MALNIPSYEGDPTSTAPVVNAYAEVIDFRISSLRQTVNFTVGYYRSQADYQANAQPVNQVAYTITPNPEQRCDGASIPSYAEVLASAATQSTDAAGTLAFAIVERAVEGFLLSLPEFAGATQVS